MIKSLPAVVYKKHILGLLWDNGKIEVLRSSRLKGAPLINPSEIIDTHASEDIRAATIEDFQAFKVCHNESFLLNQSNLVKETTGN